ncbi:methyltransferase domain-containing protein [Lederbergia citrea]|uniref:methyltransferase domain-containing protein n=1 Tax=Lederbergia citrea TaxID=2833581 RepID=UPI001BC91FEC|nr:methyltransferase domain-containing protein [Lederbergia citrea]MBS4205379.1 methyltransferase domain-containing protein [Lederbergia citrea]
MITDEKFEILIERTNQPFTGWNFSYITDTGRMSSEPLSWSYGSMAVPLIQNATSMLDMGTGGGEFLSMLRPFPKVVCATEGFPPNVSVAKDRLEPLGIEVVQVENDNQLPFKNGYFDLILNKHESYSCKEIRRIISENGIFLTQQVGGQDYLEINQELKVPINNEFQHWNLAYAQAELKQSGFEILECKEEFPYQRFYDIGALVYYLKAIPWQAPDFDVEKDKDQLYEIHRLIEKKGYFEVMQHRFFIKARPI